MSPRGLISILLFIQLNDINFINLDQRIIDERVLLVVILTSMIVMLLGTIKKTQPIEEPIFSEDESVSIEMDLDPNYSKQDDNENP